MSKQRIKIVIPVSQLQQYKRFSNRAKVLHGANPHLNIDSICGADHGDLEVYVVIPAPEADDTKSDDLDNFPCDNSHDPVLSSEPGGPTKGPSMN